MFTPVQRTQHARLEWQDQGTIIDRCAQFPKAGYDAYFLYTCRANALNVDSTQSIEPALTSEVYLHMDLMTSFQAV